MRRRADPAPRRARNLRMGPRAHRGRPPDPARRTPGALRRSDPRRRRWSLPTSAVAAAAAAASSAAPAASTGSPTSPAASSLEPDRGSHGAAVLRAAALETLGDRGRDHVAANWPLLTLAVVVAINVSVLICIVRYGVYPAAMLGGRIRATVGEIELRKRDLDAEKGVRVRARGARGSQEQRIGIELNSVFVGEHGADFTVTRGGRANQLLGRALTRCTAGYAGRKRPDIRNRCSLRTEGAMNRAHNIALRRPAQD